MPLMCSLEHNIIVPESIDGSLEYCSILFAYTVKRIKLIEANHPNPIFQMFSRLQTKKQKSPLHDLKNIILVSQYLTEIPLFN